MFTGLIEEIGAVKHIKRTDDSFDLTIGCAHVLEGVALGDSIAVNGVCLTVTAFTEDSFTVGLAPETLKRSNLGALSAGAGVNLERAVTPSTRLGGHYVQGHIDGVGTIIDFTPDADALWVRIKTDPDLMRYIVTKGFIAIDGTSLTVVDTGADWFNVTLVNYTQSKIVMPSKAVGEAVNLEVDILAKYVERLVGDAYQTPTSAEAVSQTFIQEGAN